MNNIILSEEFDLRKLKFFFQSARKGFVLLTINEYHIMQEMQGYLSEWIAPTQYNMAESSFRDVVDDFSGENAVDSAVFYHFYQSDEDNRKILEQFNLGRDLILDRMRFCVFMVPVYMESYIQESLPNLYSYFQIKERFLRERQDCFQYILPEDHYRETRFMQQSLQRRQKDGRDEYMPDASQTKQEESRNNLFQHLNDYLYVKVSHEEFLKLKQEMMKFLDSIRDSELQSDVVLFYQTVMKFVKVATVQEEYEEVLQWFDLLQKEISNVEYIYQYLEIEMGMADSAMYVHKYEETKELCFYALQMIQTKPKDLIDDNSRKEYQIRIYAKLVLCQTRLGEVKEAKETMAKTLDLINTLEEWDNIDVFLIYYNFFIIYLKIFSGRTVESEKMLAALKQIPKDEVQQAMYLTVCAWYEGIIEGRLYHAVGISEESLKLKQQLYPENDARIAESYYMDALLHFFVGDDRAALWNCQECAKIPVSPNRNIDLKEINQILWKEIKQYVD